MSQSENEKSLEQQFASCESVVDDLLKGRLGDSKSSQRNETLRQCLQTLHSLANTINGLSLFSANDSIDELPTSSLRFLLVPAYLATVLQEIGVKMDQKGDYLRASKSNYREFLQNMSVFGVINFHLPWLEENEDQRSCDQSEDREEGRNRRPAFINSFEDAKARRKLTISRIQQMEHLEKTVEQLRNEMRRNDDEALQRETILTLLRLWSIRSVKELDMIEEELKMVEHFEKHKAHPATPDDSASTSDTESFRFKPFILARTEAQKRVFGLGYPSVPTKTVDEWYDEMQKRGTFGMGSSSSFTIGQRKTGNGEEEEENGEEKEERNRQANIKRDEWKDWNRRGCGNTYNKG